MRRKMNLKLKMSDHSVWFNVKRDCKRFGVLRGLGTVIAVTFRLFMIKYFRESADKIISRRKGKCLECGRCCQSPDCKYLINNKCSVYKDREKLGYVFCLYAPMPADLAIGHPKWKGCGYYYGKKKNN